MYMCILLLSCFTVIEIYKPEVYGLNNFRCTIQWP